MKNTSPRCSTLALAKCTKMSVSVCAGGTYGRSLLAVGVTERASAKVSVGRLGRRRLQVHAEQVVRLGQPRLGVLVGEDAGAGGA